MTKDIDTPTNFMGCEGLHMNEFATGVEFFTKDKFMVQSDFAQDVLGRTLTVGDAVLCPSGSEFSVKFIKSIETRHVQVIWWSASGKRYTKRIYKSPQHGVVSSLMQLTTTERDVVYRNL